MENAKKELLEDLEFYNLSKDNIKEAIVSCSRMDMRFDYKRHRIDNFIASLALIDYDEAYGSQYLFGFIIFHDGSWLERPGEDGVEKWVYKKIPIIDDLPNDPEMWNEYLFWKAFQKARANE